MILKLSEKVFFIQFRKFDRNKSRTVADESSTDVLFDEDMKVSLSESSVSSSLENGPSSSKHDEDKVGKLVLNSQA